MGNKCINLVGKKFGRLLVLERVENKGESIIWKCQCDCGKIKNIRGAQLKCRDTISCGCYKKENMIIIKTKHNMVNTKIYKRYATIKRRCYNKNNNMYRELLKKMKEIK